MPEKHSRWDRAASAVQPRSWWLGSLFGVSRRDIRRAAAHLEAVQADERDGRPTEERGR